MAERDRDFTERLGEGDTGLLRLPGVDEVYSGGGSAAGKLGVLAYRESAEPLWVVVEPVGGVTEALWRATHRQEGQGYHEAVHSSEVVAVAALLAMHPNPRGVEADRWLERVGAVPRWMAYPQARGNLRAVFRPYLAGIFQNSW